MIDHYSEVETAFMAKIRTLTEFFPKAWQVSDDVSVIQKGADYFLITIPSTFTGRKVDSTHKDKVWNVLFDVYVRYREQREALTRFKAVRAALDNLVDADPYLDGTPGVFDITLTATSELQQDIPGDNPNFIIQTLSAAISQRIRFR